MDDLVYVVCVRRGCACSGAKPLRIVAAGRRSTSNIGWLKEVPLSFVNVGKVFEWLAEEANGTEEGSMADWTGQVPR